MTSKTQNVLLHIAGWSVWLMIIYFLQPPSSSLNAQPLIKQSIFKRIVYFTSIMQIPVFYINSKWLMEKFFTKKRYLLYFMLLLSVFLLYFLSSWLFVVICSMGSLISVKQSSNNFPIEITIFPFFIVVVVSTSYKYVSDSLKKERLLSQKEREALQSELLFLKSQTSPHFIFNVLNNMVSLARKKSNKLETVLIQLSSTLHYMLYDSNVDRISLQKESNYLKNYIELQRLRYGDYIDIDFKETTPENDCLIAPMLLIPFVENAFKHGTNLYGEGFIKIILDAENEYIHFSVTNKYNTAEKENNFDKTSGIGLKNVKRRLLLLYPDKHSLTIKANEEDSVFFVDLIINLE
jgi:Putative regulator of cell autolysis